MDTFLLCSDYTEGYHDLMKHLAKHFNQASILRVVRALAAFRPSLIALQYVCSIYYEAYRSKLIILRMPLTTEDEVFLEKSFQRTLIVRTRVASRRRHRSPFIVRNSKNLSHTMERQQPSGAGQAKSVWREMSFANW